ncbi:MAG: TIGR01906 family membrane protein [Lachnospiraceae bacterium]|nr:TIGR01906 family membrane protein [Candidatus Equihabitans merdae]
MVFRKITRACAGTLAMFLLILVLFISAFQIVIYGDSSYKHYQKEYEKYLVTNRLNMEMDDVMDVTSYMMDYLIGKEDTLSYETTINGEKKDFFNDQDRFHMGEVKVLFLQGLKLRTICIVMVLLLILGLIINRGPLFRLLLRCYIAAIGLIAAFAALVGVVAMKDFTIVFTKFHHVFFDNNDWLFDPARDYMINMLPEGFFSDMLIFILIVFANLLLVAGAIMLVRLYIEERR